MTAIFPGSFDPPTYGHLDIIRRAAALFSHVLVAVMINSEKQTMFTGEERVEMLKECCRDIPGVEVLYWAGMTGDLARQYTPAVLVKGMRTASDFDYEAMIAAANLQAEGLDTLFLLAQPEHSRINSTVVREFGSRGGSVSAWAPPPVEAAIQRKFHNEKV